MFARVLTFLSCLLLLWAPQGLARLSAQQAQPGGRIPTLVPSLPEAGQKDRPPILIPPLNVQGNQAPMSVVVVFGTGQSMQGKMPKAREACAAIVQKLEPKTNAGLVLYHDKVYQTADVGTDRKKLAGLIDNAKAGGGNAWREATAKAIDMLAAQKTAGPRVVLLVTDGEDASSKITLPQLTAHANKHGVRIWAVQVGAGGQGLPVRSVLTLDRSTSMKGLIENLRQAAMQFVVQMPQGMGDATVVTFALDIERPLPLQGRFTNRQQELVKTIQKGTDKPQIMTKCWSATGEAIETLKRGRIPGLRVKEHVILFTDGRPVGEKKGTLEKVIAKAKKENIAVHVLLFTKQPPPKKKKGVNKPWPLSKPQMKKIQELVNGTGGSLAIIAGPNQVAPNFAILAKKLRPQFTPIPSLQTLTTQTKGIYGPVPNPQDLPAGLTWIADRLNEQNAPKK